MNTNIVIGLDLGTTSAKAVAFHFTGTVIGECEIPYTLYTPQPHYAEQDPLEIERAAIRVLRQLIETYDLKQERIATVGLSTAMHSVICIDQQGNPLSPAITWADRRANIYAERVKQNMPHIYEQTGVPLHPMSPFIKLLWMHNQQYAPYEKADYFVSIKEFLLYRWFGIREVDYSIAAATGLFNAHTLTWDEEALELAHITTDQLFHPVAPTTKTPPLSTRLAMEMGLPVGIPFVIGGSDGPLATLGVGAIEEGDFAITIGTSGAIRHFTKNKKVDSSHSTFLYPFADAMNLVGGPTNNGGIALQWLKTLLAYDDSYESFVSLAERAPAGSDGLIFSPYLHGERAPMWNAHIPGNLFGLNARHERHHIIRAVLEGIVFSIYHVAEIMEQTTGAPKRLFVNGGFTQSPFAVQVLANIFQKEVFVPATHQSSAWGAAWTALVGIGIERDFSSIQPHIPMKDSFQPNEATFPIYEKQFQQYKKISQQLEKWI
ncbi:MAG TPA: gluconokinase [Savagea sp.]